MEAENCEAIPTSSGRLRQASRNFCKFWSRNSTEPPLRSCSQNEKPPALPRPGIEGGEKANATASGTCAASVLFKDATTPLASSSFLVRSPQGVSPTKKKP